MVMQLALAIKNISWPNNDPRGSKSVVQEIKFIVILCIILAVWLGRDSNSLRDGRSVDRIPVGTRFSAPVQTSLGAHPASYTMDMGSLLRVKRSERDVYHPQHLAPRLNKEHSYTSTPPLGLRGLF